MSLRLNGSTSGYVEIDAPAVAGTTSITIPATSGEAVVKAANGSVDLGSVDIDSSGRLLVGISSSRSVGVSSVYPGRVQVETTDYTGLTLCQNTNDAFGVQLNLGKSRGSTVGGTTVVQSGDSLGIIQFAGADGTDLETPAASIEARVDGTPGANDMPGRLVFSTTADGAASPTERMRISNNGSIYIADTFSYFSGFGGGGSGGVRWRATTQTTECQMEGYATGTGTSRHILFSNPNGVVGSITTALSATAYNTSSDYRLKENVTPVTDGITRLQQLKPSRFNFIADPDKTVDGFLAHEVQAIVPEAITGEKDAVDDEGNPEYQGIDQSKLVPLLTAALQEAVSRIETLEAKVAALEVTP